MSTQGLQKAIAKAGSQRELAELLGVRQSHISNWLRRNKRVPAGRVCAIEAATGVPRHELRPDLYPEPNCGGHA
jgi:DNA-binding transcriptional regulator YdaS (Cro superfamily)